MLNSHTCWRPDAAAKRAMIAFMQERFDAGSSMQLTANALYDRFPVAQSQAEHMVAKAWPLFERERARVKAAEEERIRLASKEARAVALYDALVALGWTPPHA